MNQTIYNGSLVLHVIGITLMAGTTFLDFILCGQFWRMFANDRPRALALEAIISRLQRFMGIGMLLILLSGIGMMAYLHKVWGQQLWFQVKMGILLLVILNGLALRRVLGSRIKKTLDINPTVTLDQLARLKAYLTSAQSIQLMLFVVIFTLSIFKFN